MLLCCDNLLFFLYLLYGTSCSNFSQCNGTLNPKNNFVVFLILTLCRCMHNENVSKRFIDSKFPPPPKKKKTKKKTLQHLPHSRICCKCKDLILIEPKIMLEIKIKLINPNNVNNNKSWKTARRLKFWIYEEEG